jgi:pimeloyl-ACP methyl ester carboxylesterase
MMRENWEQRIGNQRDWVWRGWQTRYTYKRSPKAHQGRTSSSVSSSVNASQTPLILLHGFGAAIEHWRKNIPTLSQYHTVYALDLLGFGASRKAETEYTSYLWAQQVYDFWKTFIGKSVVLVGNSIGSLVCLTAAAAYPDMVKGIVMISLPDLSMRQEMIPKPLQPLVSSIESFFAFPPLLKGLFRLLRSPGVIRRWAGVAYFDEQAVTAELVQILAAPAQDPGADRTFVALFKAINRPGFAPAAKVVLPQLEIPMLLVWGKCDRMVPPTLAPAFAKLNPRLQLLEIEEAGHCVHDECPDKFNDFLLNWLNNKFH